MLLFCHSFFPFSHETSTPVVSMDILNFSTRRLVISYDFYRVSSSSTITHLHGWVFKFNLVKMNTIIPNGDHLDKAENIQSIILFSHNKLSIGVKPWMEVTLQKAKSTWRISTGQILVV